MMRSTRPAASDACQYREQVAAPGEAARGNFTQGCPDRWREPGEPVGETQLKPAASDFFVPDPFQGLRRELPKFVKACSENPDPNKPRFACFTWSPELPQIVKRAPYTCRSWRCPFGCAEHEGHVMYSRICEAFTGKPKEELVFLVLTLDSHLHDLRSVTLDFLYKSLGKRFEKFRKRLRRLLAKRLGFLRPFGIEWVSVIEQHADGVPHMNVLLWCPEYAAWLKERAARKRSRHGMHTSSTRLMAGTRTHRDGIDEMFFQLLDACGFGYRSSAEVVRNREAAMGYMGGVAGRADDIAAKVAGRLDRSSRARTARANGKRVVGELSKLAQLPVRAPKGFRRLRSGVGFLPPRRKSDQTGCIVQRYWTTEGEVVRSINQTKKPELAAMQALVCDLEQSIVWSEDEKARPGIARATPRKARGESCSMHRLDAVEMARVGLTPRVSPSDLMREARVDVASRAAAS